MCEQTGTRGNIKQEELAPIEYIDSFDNGELTELLKPARDDEETEAFRARYIFDFYRFRYAGVNIHHMKYCRFPLALALLSNRIYERNTG